MSTTTNNSTLTREILIARLSESSVYLEVEVPGLQINSNATLEEIHRIVSQEIENLGAQLRRVMNLVGPKCNDRIAACILENRARLGLVERLWVPTPASLSVPQQHSCVIL